MRNNYDYKCAQCDKKFNLKEEGLRCGSKMNEILAWCSDKCYESGTPKTVATKNLF